MKNKEWESFKICDIFDIVLSRGDNQADMLESGKIPLVSSGMNNNGVCKFIKNGDGLSKIFDRNTITIDMFGKPFYHDYKFFAVSHGRVNILIPKVKINKEIGMFLVTTIEKSTIGKYSYNRMCSQSRLENQLIMLPVNEDKMPDYKYMEEYIRNIQSHKINKYIKYKINQYILD